MLSVCAEPRLVVLEPRDFETLRRYCVVNRAHLAPWEPSRDASYHDAAQHARLGRRAPSAVPRQDRLSTFALWTPAAR